MTGELGFGPLVRRSLHQVGEMATVERMALLAIVIGVAARILTFWLMDLRDDGGAYVAMARSWAVAGEFLMPYGDATTGDATGPQYSHHYPPVYPIYLGMAIRIFGYSLMTVKAAAILCSILVVGVVWWVTRNLYGHTPALATTAVFALEPHLIQTAGVNFSENLVLIFFALAMWAILRSLQDDRYVLLAGLFAGLAYLTRSSMGYFFLVAGVAGLVWRYHHRGRKAVTNPFYLAAIGIFLGIAAVWAFRNVALFGWEERTLSLPLIETTLHWPNWQTSTYVDNVMTVAFAHPDLWSQALGLKIPLFLVFVAIYAVWFPGEVRKSLLNLREEHESALWLAVVLVVALAWILSAMFWVYEQTHIWWLDNHRYVVIAYLPLLWAILRRVEFDRPGPRVRLAGLLMISLVATAVVLAAPQRWPDVDAARFLDERLEDGDVIQTDGQITKYAFYPYLAKADTIDVHDRAFDPPGRFIVARDLPGPYEGYGKVAEFSRTYIEGTRMTISVWERVGE